MNKKQLYNKIIQNVSKIVKKSINEAFDFNDINKNQTKSKNKTLVKNAVNNSIVEGFDFGGVKSDKNEKFAKSAHIEYIKYYYSIEIKNKILNHIKLIPYEMQILCDYASIIKKCLKIEVDELLPLIIYYIVDNDAYNLNWINIDKFLEDNKLNLDPQEEFILTYMPTKEDVSKIKGFLTTIKDLESTLPPGCFSPLTLVVSPINGSGDIITSEWDWNHNKILKKFEAVKTTQIDGNYTASEFLENKYLLCLLIKQLALLTKIEEDDIEINININVGYNLLDLDNIYHSNEVVQKISEIPHIQENVNIDILDEGYSLIWVKNIKNLDDALDKLIIFAKEYINQYNLYIKELKNEL